MGFANMTRPDNAKMLDVSAGAALSAECKYWTNPVGSGDLKNILNKATGTLHIVFLQSLTKFREKIEGLGVHNYYVVQLNLEQPGGPKLTAINKCTEHSNRDCKKLVVVVLRRYDASKKEILRESAFQRCKI
eukprot:m.301031 g.301031  ORF g.301031 m.301031 type:complete len:132 (+) comp22993_c1_seq3:615-1010(+)